ncbi:MAG: lipopolysaccharide biosynthesis protein [Cyanobacteria bacterium SZAS-4]|nr:lipopolysaccharide biosynthesis protein [Cyanobacteria bacterium SZAS-4]
MQYMFQTLPPNLATSGEAESASRHFDTDHLSADLGKRTVKGGFVTLLSQVLKLLLQIGSMVLLARLLTPVDYGLFGIVSAVTALGLIIKDMGLAAATLNSPTLNHAQVSNLLWITVGRNLILASVTCAMAPLVAQFYGDSRLTPLLVAMASTFVILSLSSQHQALLRRQMRFRSLAAIDLISMLFGVVVAVLCASFGAQIWALVGMQMSMAIASTIGSWLLCTWRPGLPRRQADNEGLLEFGKQIVAFQVMEYCVRNVDSLLIGRWCGEGILGLYDRAFQLHMIPAQNICWPIGAVVLGTLSRVRSEAERFNKYAMLTIFSSSCVCMPIIAFLFVTSHEAVSLLLGDNWNGTVNIFRALAPAAFFDSIVVSLGWIFVASNLGDRLLKCSVIQTVASVAGFFIGIRWGAVGVAIVLSVIKTIAPVSTILYCTRNTDISAMELLKAPFPPILASLIAAAICFGCGVNAHVSVLQFLTDGLIFAASYTCVLACFARTRELFSLILSLVKSRISRALSASGC